MALPAENRSSLGLGIFQRDTRTRRSMTPLRYGSEPTSPQSQSPTIISKLGRRWSVTERYRPPRNTSLPDEPPDSGKKLEAAAIVEILKKQLAVLPGGRSRAGCPVIVVPAHKDTPESQFEEMVSSLTYLASIPSFEVRQRGFVVFIDVQNNVFVQLKSFLRAIQHALGKQVRAVLILRNRQKTPPDLKREKAYLEFQIQYTTCSKLSKIVDHSQLVVELGGNMRYNHDHWLNSRLSLEKFVKEAQAVLHHLETVHLKISSYLAGVTEADILDRIEKNRSVYQSALEATKHTIESGKDLLLHFDIDGDSGFRFPAENNADVQEAKNLVEAQVNALTTEHLRLQAGWRTAEVRYRNSANFHNIEKRIKEVVEWMLGPGEELLNSQQTIGDSFMVADDLRKQHEQLELNCTATYGTYAELCHRVDKWLQQHGRHVDARNVVAQKEYMDTVCRSFASRLERRRNLLITSVRFHRMAQELYQKLMNLEEYIQTESIPEDLYAIESAFQNMLAKQEDIVSRADLAAQDGNRLIDMLAMPIKNAFGKDITPNYSQTILHVKRLMARVDEHRSRGQELVDLHRLRLRQVKQLCICEVEALQSTSWLEELCDVMLAQHIQMGLTSEDCSALLQEHSKFEETVKTTYRYSAQMLDTAQSLRQSCQHSPAPNNELRGRLQALWNAFMTANAERKMRLRLCETFHKKIDKSVQEVEKLLCEVKEEFKTTSPTRRIYVRRRFIPLRENVHSDLLRAKQLGASVLNRVCTPVLPNWKVGGIEQSVDEHAVQQIQEKLKHAATKMEELDQALYGSARQKPLPDSRRSSIRSTASTYVTAVPGASSIDDWQSCPSTFNSGDEWRSGDEYLSADDAMSARASSIGDPERPPYPRTSSLSNYSGITSGIASPGPAMSYVGSNPSPIGGATPVTSSNSINNKQRLVFRDVASSSETNEFRMSRGVTKGVVSMATTTRRLKEEWLYDGQGSKHNLEESSSTSRFSDIPPPRPPSPDLSSEKTIPTKTPFFRSSPLRTSATERLSPTKTPDKNNSVSPRISPARSLIPGYKPPVPIRPAKPQVLERPSSCLPTTVTESSQPLTNGTVEHSENGRPGSCIPFSTPDTNGGNDGTNIAIDDTYAKQLRELMANLQNDLHAA